MQTEVSTRTQSAGTAEVAAAAAELVTNGSVEMGAHRPDDAGRLRHCCPPTPRSTSTTCPGTTSPNRSLR
jgi:hypothetical protein